jgi:putative tricarboxylic transport membrane protein
MNMRKEYGGSLIFLISGIYGFVFSIQLPFGKLTEPGPGMFPLSLSLLLLLSGILIFIHGKGKVKAVTGGGRWMNQLVTPVQIVGLTIIFSILLEKIGYLVTTPVYLFILFVWVCRYKFWIAAGLAIVLGMGSWYFFVKLLVIRLPAGILSL